MATGAEALRNNVAGFHILRGCWKRKCRHAGQQGYSQPVLRFHLKDGNDVAVPPSAVSAKSR